MLEGKCNIYGILVCLVDKLEWIFLYTGIHLFFRGDQTLQKPSKLATADGEVALTFVDYDRASLLEGRGGLGMDNFVYYDLVVVWIRGYNNLCESVSL